MIPTEEEQRELAKIGINVKTLAQLLAERQAHIDAWTFIGQDGQSHYMHPNGWGLDD